MTETPRGDVSIVVPAYREERRIGAAVRELAALAAGFPRVGQVLIVVEPGGDRTAEIARAAAQGNPVIAVIESDVHRGKGHSVRQGMLRASGEIIFFMDADLSVPLGYVAPFVAHMDANPPTDVAIGSRRHRGSVIRARQSFFREQAGRWFNRAVRLMGLGSSKDTQCGFKAFRRAAARGIFSRAQIDGFAFDVEALCIARGLGQHIDELPVEWSNDRDTKFHPLRDGWRSFRDLLRMRRGLRRLVRGG